MKSIFFAILFLLPSLSTHASDPKQDALSDYLQIQALLAHDTFPGVVESAKMLMSDSKSLPEAKKIKDATETLAKTKDLASAREAFIPLSLLMRDWAKKAQPKGVITVYCPMKEAYWVQKKSKVENPYLGKEMLECGVVE